MFGWEFPPFKSGGLGTYLHGFTKSLSKKGAKVTFVMPATGVKINPDFVNIVQASDEYSHLDEVIGLDFDFHPYVPSLSVHSYKVESDKSKSSRRRSCFQKEMA